MHFLFIETSDYQAVGISSNFEYGIDDYSSNCPTPLSVAFPPDAICCNDESPLQQFPLLGLHPFSCSDSLSTSAQDNTIEHVSTNPSPLIDLHPGTALDSVEGQVILGYSTIQDARNSFANLNSELSPNDAGCVNVPDFHAEQQPQSPLHQNTACIILSQKNSTFANFLNHLVFLTRKIQATLYLNPQRLCNQLLLLMHQR